MTESLTHTNGSLDLCEHIQGALERIAAGREDVRRDAEETLAGTGYEAFNRSLLQVMQQRLPLLEHLPNGMKLRLSQLRGFRQFIDFLAGGGNERNTGYFIQPTGAGKTVLYSLIAFLLDRPTVVFVPTTGLLTQTKEEMTGLGIPEPDIGLIGGGFSELTPPKKILIVTYHSHNRKMDAAEHEDYTGDLRTRQLVICDEAHRSMGKRTRAAREGIAVAQETPEATTTDDAEQPEMDMTEDSVTPEEEAQESQFLERLEKDIPTRKDLLTLGCTATPDLEEKSIHTYFHQCIAKESYDELISAGILVAPTVVRTGDATVYDDELDHVNEDDESAIAEREHVSEKLNLTWLALRNAANHPLYTAAFFARHEDCERHARDCQKHGIRCRIVTSKTSSSSRDLEEAVQQLLTGQIDQLIGVGKFIEGSNIPPLNCVLWGRATQSPAILIQAVGRAMRAFRGNSWRGTTLKGYLGKDGMFFVEPKWVRMSRAVRIDQDGKPPEKGAGCQDGKKKESTGGSPIVSGDKPMTLIRAFASLGEDPDGVVANAHEIEDDAVKIPPNATEWQGRNICTIASAARAHGMRTSGPLTRMLRTAEHPPRAIPGWLQNGRAVYDANEMATFILEQQQATQAEITKRVATEKPARPAPTLFQADARGRLTVKHTEAVVTDHVRDVWIEAGGHELSEDQVLDLVRSWGIVPVQKVNVRDAAGKPTWAYSVGGIQAAAQLEVSSTLPRVQRERGQPWYEVRYNDGSVERAWNMEEFASDRHISRSVLGILLKNIGIPRIEHRVQRPVVYREHDLKAVAMMLLRENGSTQIPDVRSNTPGEKRTAVSTIVLAREAGCPLDAVTTRLTNNGVFPVREESICRPGSVSREVGTMQRGYAVRWAVFNSCEDPVHGPMYWTTHNRRIIQGQKYNMVLIGGDIISGENITNPYWLDEAAPVLGLDAAALDSQLNAPRRLGKSDYKVPPKLSDPQGEVERTQSNLKRFKQGSPEDDPY